MDESMQLANYKPPVIEKVAAGCDREYNSKNRNIHILARICIFKYITSNHQLLTMFVLEFALGVILEKSDTRTL